MLQGTFESTQSPTSENTVETTSEQSFHTEYSNSPSNNPSYSPSSSPSNSPSSNPTYALTNSPTYAPVEGLLINIALYDVSETSSYISLLAKSQNGTCTVYYSIGTEDSIMASNLFAHEFDLLAYEQYTVSYTDLNSSTKYYFYLIDETEVDFFTNDDQIDAYLSFETDDAFPTYQIDNLSFSNESAVLNLTLSESGYAACMITAASSYFSASYILQSAEKHYAADDLTVSFVFNNLAPFTDYVILCVTEDNGPINQALTREEENDGRVGNILLDSYLTDNRISLTTTCCKFFFISGFPEFMRNGTRSPVISMEFSSPSETQSVEVEIRVISKTSGCAGLELDSPNDITSMNENDTIRVYPRRLIFAADETKKEFKLAVNGGAGCFTLHYQFIGAANEIYDNTVTQEIMVVGLYDEPPSPPSVVSMAFAKGGLEIHTLFSTDTDAGSLVGPDTEGIGEIGTRRLNSVAFNSSVIEPSSCSDYFVFNGSSLANCSWTDARTLVAVLSQTHYPKVGETVSLISGKIRSACTSTDSSSCSGWTSSADFFSELHYDNSSTDSIQVSIIGPELVSTTCDGDIQTDIVTNYFTPVIWGNSGLDVSYNWYYNNRLVRTSSVYSLRRVAGSNTVSLKLVSEELESYTYQSIEVMSETPPPYSPLSWIEAPSTLNWTDVTVPLKIGVKAYSCNEILDSIDIFVNWTIEMTHSYSDDDLIKVNVDLVNVLVNATSFRSRQLILPAFSLDPGIYNITATVFYNVSSVTTSANRHFVTVSVAPLKVEAHFRNGDEFNKFNFFQDMETVNPSLSITATQSYVIDASSSFTSVGRRANLSVSWSCIEFYPNFGQSCGNGVEQTMLQANTTNLAYLNITTGLLPSGIYYKFSVTLSANYSSLSCSEKFYFGDNDTSTTICASSSSSAITPMTDSCSKDIMIFVSELVHPVVYAETSISDTGQDRNVMIRGYLNFLVPKFSASSVISAYWTSVGQTVPSEDMIQYNESVISTSFIVDASHEEQNISMNLPFIMPSTIFQAEIPYIFQLSACMDGTCGFSQVTIVVNRAPRSGKVEVSAITTSSTSPSFFELKTPRRLSTYDWLDEPDDLPLMYWFGYSYESDITSSSLKSTSTTRTTSDDTIAASSFVRRVSRLSYANAANVHLPAGDLIIYGFACDNRGSCANVVCYETVKTTYSKESEFEAKFQTRLEDYMTTMNTEWILPAISGFGGKLVSNACPTDEFCFSKNRNKCGKHFGLCGICLDGFDGIIGPSNDKCLQTSSMNALCSNNRKNVDYNETDVDCGGAFCLRCEEKKRCADDDDCYSGKCVKKFCAAGQHCPYNCRGSADDELDRGACVHTDRFTNIISASDCNSTNSGCFLNCQCDDGYYGPDCGWDSKVPSLAAARIILLQYLSYYIQHEPLWDAEEAKQVLYTLHASMMDFNTTENVSLPFNTFSSVMQLIVSSSAGLDSDMYFVTMSIMDKLSSALSNVEKDVILDIYGLIGHAHQQGLQPGQTDSFVGYFAVGVGKKFLHHNESLTIKLNPDSTFVKFPMSVENSIGNLRPITALINAKSSADASIGITSIAVAQIPFIESSTQVSGTSFVTISGLDASFQVANSESSEQSVSLRKDSDPLLLISHDNPATTDDSLLEKSFTVDYMVYHTKNIEWSFEDYTHVTRICPWNAVDNFEFECPLGSIFDMSCSSIQSTMNLTCDMYKTYPFSIISGNNNYSSCYATHYFDQYTSVSCDLQSMDSQVSQSPVSFAFQSSSMSQVSYEHSTSLTYPQSISTHKYISFGSLHSFNSESANYPATSIYVLPTSLSFESEYSNYKQNKESLTSMSHVYAPKNSLPVLVVMILFLLPALPFAWKLKQLQKSDFIKQSSEGMFVAEMKHSILSTLSSKEDVIISLSFPMPFLMYHWKEVFQGMLTSLHPLLKLQKRSSISKCRRFLEFFSQCIFIIAAASSSYNLVVMTEFIPCSTYYLQSSCLEDKTWYTAARNRCLWDTLRQQCRYNDPELTANMIVTVAGTALVLNVFLKLWNKYLFNKFIFKDCTAPSLKKTLSEYDDVNNVVSLSPVSPLTMSTASDASLKEDPIIFKYEEFVAKRRLEAQQASCEGCIKSLIGKSAQKTEIYERGSEERLRVVPLLEEYNAALRRAKKLQYISVWDGEEARKDYAESLLKDTDKKKESKRKSYRDRKFLQNTTDMKQLASIFTKNLSEAKISDIDATLDVMQKQWFIDKRVGIIIQGAFSRLKKEDRVVKKIIADLTVYDKVLDKFTAMSRAEDKDVFLMQLYRMEMLSRMERSIYKRQLLSDDQVVQKCSRAQKVFGYVLLILSWYICMIFAFYWARRNSSVVVLIWCSSCIIAIIQEVSIQTLIRVLIMNVLLPSSIKKSVYSKTYGLNTSSLELSIRSILPATPSQRVAIVEPDLISSRIILGRSTDDLEDDEDRKQLKGINIQIESASSKMIKLAMTNDKTSLCSQIKSFLPSLISWFFVLPAGGQDALFEILISIIVSPIIWIIVSVVLVLKWYLMIIPGLWTLYFLFKKVQAVYRQRQELKKDAARRLIGTRGLFNPVLEVNSILMEDKSRREKIGLGEISDEVEMVTQTRPASRFSSQQIGRGRGNRGGRSQR